MLATAREVKDISQASVFSLPKYDPDKELRKLQKLWSRRGSILLSPLLCPSPSPRQQSTENNESDESRDGTTLRVVQVLMPRQLTDFRMIWGHSRASWYGRSFPNSRV